MTVDFILHGVPNGQDFWGANDDNHYFSTFYVQKSEREYLSIEARKVSGKSYCYYNYLKYNNVTASDGRAGAYLGILLIAQVSLSYRTLEDQIELLKAHQGLQ